MPVGNCTCKMAKVLSVFCITWEGITFVTVHKYLRYNTELTHYKRLNPSVSFPPNFVTVIGDH